VDGPTRSVINSLVYGLPSPFNSSSCCCNQFGSLEFWLLYHRYIATSLYYNNMEDLWLSWVWFLLRKPAVDCTLDTGSHWILMVIEHFAVVLHPLWVSLISTLVYLCV